MAQAMHTFTMPRRFAGFQMPVRQVTFTMLLRPGSQAGMTIFKNPQEVVDISYSLSLNIPPGRLLESAEVYGSRRADSLIPDQTTVLSSGAASGASTVVLPVNPLVGAFLTVNPGLANAEHLIVTNVSGTSAPFTASVLPVLTQTHVGSEPVTYEPGMNAQVLPPEAIAVQDVGIFFRVHRGVTGRQYALRLLGTLDDGQVLRGELTLAVTEE